jgi:opacity protein-like surface antigen
MKKLLVLFLSGVLVFSLAAVALAEVVINGDFRYNMYEDETAEYDSSYAETDLRIRVTGDLSDTVQASANFKWKNALEQEAADEGPERKLKTELDEFYATWKPESEWGTMKMGYYEYNFTPSRQELTSSDKKNTPKVDATFEVDLPVTEELTLTGLIMPYEGDCVGNGSYAVSAEYKTEYWGAKVSYWDLKLDDNDLMAIDVYYMLNEDIKLFADATDYSGADEKYDDGFDPVLGIQWSNIAATKLKASFEYAINPRSEGESDEYTEYILTAKYKLANNIGLEYYHYIKGDDLTKDMFRLRYEF